MKFELDSLNFQNIAKTVSKGFIPKDIRSQIQMTVTGDNLELLAFSNKSYFKGLVPLQNKEDIEDGTSWAVDGNTFKVITDLLPSISVNISFETSESSKVFNVTAPGRKLKLNILDDKMEYPDIKINNIVDVEGYKFLYAIKNLARISDLSPNKQEFLAHLNNNPDLNVIVIGDSLHCSQLASGRTDTSMYFNKWGLKVLNNRDKKDKKKPLTKTPKRTRFVKW